jgi:hypothetical protein
MPCSYISETTCFPHLEEKVEWFRYTWSIYIIKQLKIALNQEQEEITNVLAKYIQAFSNHESDLGRQT